MCTTVYPFDGETIIKLYDNIAKAEYTMPEEWSDTLRTLIEGILRYIHFLYSIQITIRPTRVHLQIS